MQSHENIMEIYFLFNEELKRKENFRKSIDKEIQDFDYYSIKNMISMEEKSDIVMQDVLLEMAKKSLNKTPIYYHMEKEELDIISQLIDDDFQYKYYHLSNYNNVLLDFSFKFWTIKPEVEKVMLQLIEKAIEYSSEDTLITLQKIKEWRNPWKDFVDKQILYYKLNDNLSIKEINSKKRKI